jgi:hypothetical protein
MADDDAAKVNINVRVSPALRDALDDEADARGLSRSEYLRQVLEERDGRPLRERVEDLEDEVAELRELVGE